jgi:hypothetical protein
MDGCNNMNLAYITGQIIDFERFISPNLTPVEKIA